MAKKEQGKSGVLKFLAWFTGVVVSLAVAFGLINGTLGLPWWLGGASSAGVWIVQAVGWIVLITTLVGAILALIRR
ncbi:hypothetical protein J4481_01800 [Candidatus Pacearchaeota archaeon]|nr:hypothetical protein [uncultured archaeon]MBS3076455.1 hypothetical protein [Candidatus Pacearchaeota archaeon]